MDLHALNHAIALLEPEEYEAEMQRLCALASAGAAGRVAARHDASRGRGAMNADAAEFVPAFLAGPVVLTPITLPRAPRRRKEKPRAGEPSEPPSSALGSGLSMVSSSPRVPRLG